MFRIPVHIVTEEEEEEMIRQVAWVDGCLIRYFIILAIGLSIFIFLVALDIIK